MANDRYWAAESPDVALRELVSRRDAYYLWLRSSNHARRIRRNWDYYHNHTLSGREDMAIEVVGSDQQQLKISVPHFRAFIKHILSYVTQNRPEWDTLAVNSDHKSLMQAELGNRILDYYMDDPQIRLAHKLIRSMEHALVLSIGYLKCCWDPFLGRELLSDPRTNQTYYRGDIAYSNPTVFDVSYDLYSPSNEELQWAIVRHRENRWDLIEKHPQQREAILRVPQAGRPDPTQEPMIDIGPVVRRTDLIDVFTFYHLKCPAMLEGREMVFLNARTWLQDSLSENKQYYYRGLPIYSAMPAEMLGTPVGYTPAFDMQGPQEAFDAEASMMISTTNATGPGIIAAKRGTITGAGIEPTKGIRFLEYDGERPPDLLDLEKSPEKRVAVADFFLRQMRALSGINAAAMGEPEPNVRAGASMAFLEGQTVRYNSPIMEAWHGLLAQIGSATLHLLKTYVTETNRKMISILGLNNRRSIKWFSGDDLSQVDRVMVRAGNPQTRLPSFRMEAAKDLLASGVIKTGEEYATVVRTGEMKPLTETLDAQLDIIHDENDLFRQGLPVPEVMKIDYHALHIPKHLAVINSVDARLDFNLVTMVMAHVQRHINLLMTDPETQILQMALGYPQSVPPMPGAGGGAIPGLPPGMPVPATPPGSPPGGAAGSPESPERAVIEKGQKAPGGTVVHTQGQKPRLQMEGKPERAA